MLKLIPLVVFLVLAGFLAKGLTLDPSALPSPLIDKPAPAFELATLPAQKSEPFVSSEMLGRVWVLNVWASWCVACVDEHPLLVEFAESSEVTLVGLNYKDKPDAAMAWLGELGNPYDIIADDQEGEVGIDWGVYGVPETFVIDTDGNVRYKHIGPIDEETVRTMITPLVEQLRESGAPS